MLHMYMSLTGPKASSLHWVPAVSLSSGAAVIWRGHCDGGEGEGGREGGAPVRRRGRQCRR